MKRPRLPLAFPSPLHPEPGPLAPLLKLRDTKRGKVCAVAKATPPDCGGIDEAVRVLGLGLVANAPGVQAPDLAAPDLRLIDSHNVFQQIPHEQREGPRLVRAIELDADFHQLAFRSRPEQHSLED